MSSEGTAENNKGIVREIDELWNERLSAIMRNSPVEASGLRIVFDRQPDIFLIPRLRSKTLKCAGFFMRDRLFGFAMMLSKDVLVSGVLQTVLYFGNLYLEPFARGRGFFYRLSDFFLQDLPEHIVFGYAVIMQGNTAAGRLLNRFNPRYPHMPHSKVIGQWQVNNILMTFHLRKKSPYSVRHARMEDIEAMVDLLQKEYANRLFSPPVSRKTILDDLQKLPQFGIENYYLAEQDRRIVGVCCAWDMTSVKKNRVLRYGKKYKWVRGLHNMIGPLFDFPRLPAEGEPFRDVTITDYAVQNRNPDILQALLLKIYGEYHEKKYHMLIFGCAADDPLSVAAKPFMSRSFNLDILIFSKSKAFVDGFRETASPWLDMALL